MDTENTNFHTTREKTNLFSVGSQSQRKARFIAFYLPQFHPIPENNEWWGKGFTEWTNVVKAKPLFRGHYQPRIPADLGFYDLRLPEVRAAQANLAREYGIEGFCYWHYWFAGDRLLERPFDEVLKSGEPKFPFCLAWANESWTGIWYGAPNRILKAQTYPGRKDYEAHFYTLLRAFADSRYITVDGKPVLIIFRPLNLPDAPNVTDFWRNLAHKEGLKGLHLVAQLESDQHEGWDAAANGFDAVTLCNQSKILVVPPKDILSRFRWGMLGNSKIQEFYTEILQRPFRVFRYEDALPYFVMNGNFNFEYYPSVIPGWDNTPRAGLKGLILHDSTPELFRKQVRQALNVVENMPRDHRIVFIKSWNEWAEGNYIEPDQRFGKQYLEVIKDEVADSASVSHALEERATTADLELTMSRASNTKNVLDSLSGLSDQEWLQVLIRSIQEPIFNGAELPRFPADELQRQFGGSAGEHTLREAFNFYRVVKDYAARLGRPLMPNSRVLDFGCGWGRITRCFLRDIYSKNLYGIDVDPTVISICRQTFPYGTFCAGNARPPTIFDQASFNCICAYSVFSHLDEATHIQWVEEFSRILKPGGLLVVTTQGRSFLEFCRSLRGRKSYDHPWHEALARSFLDADAAFSDYDNGRFLYSPTGGGDFRPCDFYGEAVIPRAYVEREWTRFLAFRDFIDDPGFLPQALIVMQKSF